MMRVGSISRTAESRVEALGRSVLSIVREIGDLSLFAFGILQRLLTGFPRRSVLTTTMYQIGVLSLPVVIITGAFIGMVLAVQSYDQFRMMGLQTRLGAIISISLVKELGPVMAAMMLAGRVGCSIAAELGTMRVTEQIDAIQSLGADPVRHLVLPRFLACFLLIPALTAVADGVGIVGGWLFSTHVLGINSFHYWFHAVEYVTVFDVMGGLFKSVFFGAAIAVISCHRGFHCGAGSQGVGRAATETFVLSFVVILVLDFFIGMFLTTLYYTLWPASSSLVFNAVFDCGLLRAC